MSDAGAEMAERERVLVLLKRHGWNATSFQVLEAGFRYWFDSDDACIAYVDTGRAWVVAGAPIAAAERFEELTEGFRRAAADAGRRVCFFATETRFAHASSLASVYVGTQPIWDPADWDASLRMSSSLREQLRRARAKGVTVRQVTPAELAGPGTTRQAVDGVIRRWLRARPMAPMGFLVHVDPFSFPDERRYFVAELGERVVGFLAAVPVFRRNGWFLEDLLRDPVAPNGTAELLVDTAMRVVASEGSRHVTLGLAPLAGEVGQVLGAARRWGSALYDFEGIRAFKAKLRPRAWDPIYLSYPRAVGPTRAILDALAAFARGGLLRFGLESLLRGPAVVLRVLAFLLVPWTLLLALPASADWFPARGVQLAWVVFDALLVAGLLALTSRWRDGLATLLATAVTVDATLTILEALLYNLPRLLHPISPHPLQHPLEGAIVAAAVVAPTMAAFLLWRARARQAGL